jgi:hypothetical protein
MPGAGRTDGVVRSSLAYEAKTRPDQPTPRGNEVGDMTRADAPELDHGHVSAVDLFPPEIVAMLTTAARELARHTGREGRCVHCGHAWPCGTCVQADLALGSL